MKKDWLVVIVAIVGAVAVIGTYAVMQQGKTDLRTQLSQATSERDALRAGQDTGAEDYQALVAERDKLRERVAKLTSRVNEMKAQPVETAAPVAETTAATSTGNAPSGSTYSDGVYLVGTDIPAGRYKGESSGDIGYWSVNGDANGEKIIANGNPTGQFYVSVKSGQYLELSGVEVVRVE